MPTLSVPVEKMFEVQLDKRFWDAVRADAKTYYASTVFAFDIDQTLVSTDRAVSATLSGRAVLWEIKKLLKLRIPVVIVTGNALDSQAARVVPALKKLVSGEASLLHHFHMFGNKGASRLSFGPDGEEDQTKNHAYTVAHGIEASEVERLVAGLRADKLLRCGSPTGDPDDRRIETRKPLGVTVQITLKPFPPHEREEATRRIRELVGPDYEVMPSGSSSIDVGRRGVSKAKALRAIREESARESRPIDRVYYFGDEFILRCDERGHPIHGNDLEVLQDPAVHAFAVNEAQAEVPAHERLLASGSGPGATIAVLDYLHELARHAAGEGDREQETFAPRLRVPIIERVKVELPEPLSSIDFHSVAIVLRVNSLFRDPIRATQLGPWGMKTFESPILGDVARLLDKGVRIVLLSGDARDRHIEEVVSRVSQLLKGKSSIEHLTLYSSGGAARTTFCGSGEELVSALDENFGRPRKIDNLDRVKLLVAEVLAEYTSELKLRGEGDELARAFLAEARDPVDRDDGAAYSILGILPAMRASFCARLEKKLENHDVCVRSAGLRSIDITRVNVSKASALDHFRAEHSVDDLTFLYFGGEFSLTVAQTGETRLGNDMEVLQLGGLIAFAVNRDQREVEALGQGHEGKIVAAGSGGYAAHVWLKYFAANLALRLPSETD